jgi:HJR/Mrr/RecB family endonuclease
LRKPPSRFGKISASSSGFAAVFRRFQRAVVMAGSSGYLAALFQRLGYRIERTGRRGDYGADLVVWRDGTKIAVQAKRWTKNIGVKAVQEAVASKGYYKADRAMVVANRPFTQQARILARANEVELWDRERLVREMLSHPVGDTVPALQ